MLDFVNSLTDRFKALIMQGKKVKCQTRNF